MSSIYRWFNKGEIIEYQKENILVVWGQTKKTKVQSEIKNIWK